jgi:NAD(P)-dependent dehydrogenase (short-subunit alcohol dehydrogenase family)
MKLSGKVSIVTGASRGLGRAIAERFIAEGAHVVVTGRDEAALHATAEELRADVVRSEQQVLAEAGDVSDEEDVNRVIVRAKRICGRIDALVCNAGVYGPLGSIEDIDWHEWTQAVAVNLFGTVLFCRAVLPTMRLQAAGKIITLSGGGATQPLPRITAYAASKAAVVRFTESLAREVMGSGIDVNSIAPGALNTRLLDEVLAAGPARVGSEFYERSVRQKSEGGTPLSKASELVAFLASSESDGISGRLLSAIWDDWKALPIERERLADSDVYTLRRIVPKDRGWTAG